MGKKLTKKERNTTFKMLDRNKSGGKMWLSNKKGMSSCIQKQQLGERENEPTNVRLHAIYLDPYSSEICVHLWETHLDNNKYVGHIFLLLLLCYYSDCYIVTIWLSWSSAISQAHRMLQVTQYGKFVIFFCFLQWNKCHREAFFSISSRRKRV